MHTVGMSSYSKGVRKKVKERTVQFLHANKRIILSSQQPQDLPFLTASSPQEVFTILPMPRHSLTTTCVTYSYIRRAFAIFPLHSLCNSCFMFCRGPGKLSSLSTKTTALLKDLSPTTTKRHMSESPNDIALM